MNFTQPPSGLSFNDAHLGYLEKRISTDIEAGKYDGARILAAVGGKTIVDLTAGYAERATAKALTPDAVFSVMSLTKIMTAICIMRLVERGRLALTTRVASIIPEFAQRGKDRITVTQLLVHTAGLGSTPIPVAAEKAGNLAEAALAVCTVAPETVPGEFVNYSGQSAFTILGEIVVRLDEKGRAFRDILREDIFEPLGMENTAMGMPDRLRPKRVPLAVRAVTPELNVKALETRDRVADETTELPSGGVFSTAADMSRFAEALRGKGTLDGKTILSPASLHLMRQNHTGNKPNSLLSAARTIHGFAEFPAYLGLGLFLRGSGIFPSLFGSLSSPQTFGGFGLGSTTLWVDPERDITFVALTSGLMERIESILRFQALSDIVIGGLEISK
jgi:CubicO group peptidase (beta-lactamase class C family)